MKELRIPLIEIDALEKPSIYIGFRLKEAGFNVKRSGSILFPGWEVGGDAILVSYRDKEKNELVFIEEMPR